MIRPRSLLLGGAMGLLALSLATGGAAGQQRRGMGPPRDADRAQLEQRVRARFAEMIKERLGLTDEEARRLDETMESFAADRRRLVQDEQALRRRLEAVLIESDPSQEEASSLLDQMVALRAEEARLFGTEQEALRQVLDPVQLVRFHAMREQLSQRIQQLRGGGGPPMAGLRPPGGGDPWGASPRWDDAER